MIHNMDGKKLKFPNKIAMLCHMSHSATKKVEVQKPYYSCTFKNCQNKIVGQHDELHMEIYNPT